MAKSNFVTEKVHTRVDVFDRFGRFNRSRIATIVAELEDNCE